MIKIEIENDGHAKCQQQNENMESMIADYIRLRMLVKIMKKEMYEKMTELLAEEGVEKEVAEKMGKELVDELIEINKDGVVAVCMEAGKNDD